ncbi:MAG TPA: alpha/beta fold hydrolase [Thermomicrobiales bacterium]|jgi:pimeloyl-ACP methyl ester carboxylesterase|nr:alpha/beta fold hydrolase [Thermomicrobiales bacterium]
MRQPDGRPVGVLVLAFALVLSGLVPSFARAQGTPEATPANLESSATYATAACPFPVPESFVEGESLECGFLTTPLVHVNPDGEQIRLFVTRLVSTATDPMDTPLVYLAGGPGQGGSTQLPAYLPGAPLQPLLELQDVILLDQRGTGFSEPSLFCPDEAGPSIPGLTPPATATLAATPQAGATPESGSGLAAPADPLQRLVDCRASFAERGIDLTAFSSAESAADVNDLRVALGYDQVDLYSVSYGSQLGLVVERDFPSIVRAAILGSPLPPAANRFAGQVIAFDQSLASAIAQCEADPACAAANPDLSANFDRAIERLNADPLEVALVDPVTG